MDDVIGLLGDNIMRLDYKTKVHCVHIISTKFKSEIEKIQNFAPLYLSIIDGLEAAETSLVAPMMTISSELGFGADSNVMKRITNVIANQINEIGLVDCAKLAFNFKNDSITYHLLHQR